MYKHTRKKAIKQIYKQPLFTLNKSELMSLISNIEKDLLAQKEDKKECKHKRIVTSDSGWEMWFCPKCNTVIEFKPIVGNQKPSCQKCSTHSPLEIEEIEEYIFETSYDRKIFNKLIRNQKKLYQLIKEKL